MFHLIRIFALLLYYIMTILKILDRSYDKQQFHFIVVSFAFIHIQEFIWTINLFRLLFSFGHSWNCFYFTFSYIGFDVLLGKKTKKIYTLLWGKYPQGLFYVYVHIDGRDSNKARLYIYSIGRYYIFATVDLIYLLFIKNREKVRKKKWN